MRKDLKSPMSETNRGKSQLKLVFRRKDDPKEQAPLRPYIILPFKFSIKSKRAILLIEILFFSSSVISPKVFPVPMGSKALDHQNLSHRGVSTMIPSSSPYPVVYVAPSYRATPVMARTVLFSTPSIILKTRGSPGHSMIYLMKGPGNP